MTTNISGEVLRVDPAWAAEAGPRSLAFVHEIETLLTPADGKRGRALTLGVQELVRRGIIGDSDAQDIKDVAFAVFAVERGTATPAEAAKVVVPVYERLTKRVDANPVAVTVASIGRSAFMLSTDPDGNADVGVTIIPLTPVSGAIVGALFGALGGFEFGGALGAAIGAVTGAIVGAAIGWCNSNTDTRDDPGDPSGDSGGPGGDSGDSGNPDGLASS